MHMVDKLKEFLKPHTLLHPLNYDISGSSFYSNCYIIFIVTDVTASSCFSNIFLSGFCNCNCILHSYGGKVLESFNKVKGIKTGRYCST